MQFDRLINWNNQMKVIGLSIYASKLTCPVKSVQLEYENEIPNGVLAWIKIGVQKKNSKGTTALCSMFKITRSDRRFKISLFRQPRHPKSGLSDYASSVVTSGHASIAITVQDKTRRPFLRKRLTIFNPIKTIAKITATITTINFRILSEA